MLFLVKYKIKIKTNRKSLWKSSERICWLKRKNSQFPTYANDASYRYHTSIWRVNSRSIDRQTIHVSLIELLFLQYVLWYPVLCHVPTYAPMNFVFSLLIQEPCGILRCSWAWQNIRVQLLQDRVSQLINNGVRSHHQWIVMIHQSSQTYHRYNEHLAVHTRRIRCLILSKVAPENARYNPKSILLL